MFLDAILIMTSIAFSNEADIFYSTLFQCVGNSMHFETMSVHPTFLDFIASV
jgi:hypothetical protein